MSGTSFKVNSMDLQDGDGVYFKRGDLFRGQICSKDNITYSAYGVGSKPKIFGSPENGADPDNWTLVKGTDHIWVYHMNLYDTGGIVFNDGESYATRMTGLWDGTKYVEPTNYDKTVNVKNLENLEFYHPIDYSGYTTKEASIELNRTGKLYLRCDAGNPGEAYSSIEFLSNPMTDGCSEIVCLGENSIADNLCVMYGFTGGIRTRSGAKIQNCEVGWVGGCVANFDGSLVGEDRMAVIRCGDGITFGGCTNISINNSYVHHAYDAGINIETTPGDSEEERYTSNLTIKGNLVEGCSGDLQIVDWASAKDSQYTKLLFNNIMIEDNYLMQSGYGWSHLTPEFDWGDESDVNNGNCNVNLGFSAVSGKNITFKNNVFYIGKYALIRDRREVYSDQFTVKFNGNTYVQNPFGTLIEWPNTGDIVYMKKYSNNPYAKQSLSTILGDKTAIVP